MNELEKKLAEYRRKQAREYMVRYRARNNGGVPRPTGRQPMEDRELVTKEVSMTIPQWMLDEVRSIAKERGTSVSSVVSYMLAHYMNVPYDTYRKRKASKKEEL